MFTVDERNRVRDRVLELASLDRRLVAGAVVGSLAVSEGDRWSDLDLAFAVSEQATVADVLEDWSRTMAREFHAIRLFDLPASGAIYRVFLLPGCLQFDLSFAPASQFGAFGPRFKLLFGTAVHKPQIQCEPMMEVFGYAVHHAVRTQLSLERDRVMQAEYWLSKSRERVLSLACQRRGLPAAYGRGLDDLPADVRAEAMRTYPPSLEKADLQAALRALVDLLFQEAPQDAPSDDLRTHLSEFLTTRGRVASC